MACNVIHAEKVALEMESDSGSGEKYLTRTAAAIQDMIKENGLKAGDRLPGQREMAEQLSVGRSSLREALSLLEGLGLIHTMQGRGTFVAPLNDNVVDPSQGWKFSHRYSLAEIYEFRYLYEGSGIRLAAINASNDDLEELMAIHRKYERAIKTMNLVAAAGLDFDFHRAIMTITKNRFMMVVYDHLQKFMMNNQSLPFAKHSKINHPLAEHNKILESLQRRDPEAASFYMQTHLVRAADRIGIVIPNLL